MDINYNERLDDVGPYPKGFYTNFTSEHLPQYETAVFYLNDPAIVLKWGQAHCPQKGKLVATADRHSIWYVGEAHLGPSRNALSEVIDALSVKRYMPPHGVGRYQAELLPHLGSLTFQMDTNLWLEKYNFGSSGYGPHSILFNYPIEWHTAMMRLAEVMNEPGDGSEVFVLIHYQNAWHVCRDQGRETVAVFPMVYRGYCDMTHHGLRCALTVVHHLNRGNRYIPTPPRKPPHWERIKTFVQKVKLGLQRVTQGIAV